MSAQLDRLHALAYERMDNEGLYEFQRDGMGDTFMSVLAYLTGLGAISDEDMDRAIQDLRESDERTVAHRAAKAAS